MNKKRRGCGTRVNHGLYLVTTPSPSGRPVEDFLIDPPVLIDKDPFRSPELYLKEGVHHILDWVGAEYYPYVPDFIEEVKTMGISRRIPKIFPTDKLTKGSMFLFVHSRTLIDWIDRVKNVMKELKDSMEILSYSCPKQLSEHQPADQFCIGMLYPLVSLDKKYDNNSNLVVKRDFVDIYYNIRNLRELVSRSEITYKPAIFGAFPITGVEYVSEDLSVERGIADKLKQSDLPFAVVEE